MDFFHALTGTLGYSAIGIALVLAVLAHFFAPRSWSALAWVIAFGVLGAAFVGQREITAGVEVRLAEAKTENARLSAAYAQAEADARQQALEHERAITAKEQTLTATIDTNAKEARRVQTILTADRDRARAAERLVREQLATIASRYRALGAAGADTAAAGQQPPAGDAIGVLAHLLGRADERAGILAAAADAAHAAGAACERDYDTARAALINVPALGLRAPPK